NWPPAKVPAMTTGQFADIATDAITAYCAEHPAAATVLGNHSYDDRLADLGLAAADRRQAELRRLVDRLDGLSELDPAEAVDCQVLRNEACRELMSATELVEDSWDALRHN